MKTIVAGAGPAVLASVWLFGQAAMPPSVRAPEAAPKSGTAQVSDAAVELPEFEVASIKPTDLSGDIKVGVFVYPGGRVVISGCELTDLIRIAFQLSYRQISGGANWTQEIKYDVEALPPKATQAAITSLQYGLSEIGDERLRQMLQALLIDRFQLKFHRATKTGDVYLLKRNGKPPAFHPTGADPSSPRASGSRSVYRRGGQWTLDAATMPELAQHLSAHVLGAPVLDRTELSGRFDYKQSQPSLDPADPNDNLNSSFLRFVRELGLKLERTKGPVETFVIDRAAKPSPN
jgi:uncharacterized protein (TIGR03435 family)